MIRNTGSYLVDGLRLDFLRQAFLSTDPVESLLDLGCGGRPFKVMYEDKVNYSVGMDMRSSEHDQSSIDVFASGMALPFCDCSFDMVLCTEVMEHVPDPGRMLNEIYRVLTPGGKLVLTTPFLVPEHEVPIDYFRYTRYGLAHLLNGSGFGFEKILPFGELFGVALSVMVQVQCKFWSFIAAGTRLPILSSVFNPFVLLLVFLPQQLYLTSYKLLRKSKKGRTMLDRLSYSTKGFGVVAIK